MTSTSYLSPLSLSLSLSLSLALEIHGVGTVNELSAGSCFGERTLLGIASEANASVLVATPFALALAVAKQALQRALRKHPAELVAWFKGFLKRI